MPLSKILSKEQVDENKIVQKIIEMHLAADFLADSAMADACRPGNPKEPTKEDIIALYRSLM